MRERCSDTDQQELLEVSCRNPGMKNKKCYTSSAWHRIIDRVMQSISNYDGDGISRTVVEAEQTTGVSES